MKLIVMITAGGSSERMDGINKTFALICGKPIIIRSIEAFSKINVDIIVSTKKDKIPLLKTLCISYGLKAKIIPGGNTRYESVKNMLMATDATYDFALVHDGARPLLSQEDLALILENCEKHADGIIAVSKVTDTVKTVASNGIIMKTADRESLRFAQTPQVFKIEILKEAYKKAYEDSFVGTDEASLVERLGKHPAIIETKYPNPKITYKEDIIYCEALLKSTSINI